MAGFKCPYCERTVDFDCTEIDHKLPESRGGGDEVSNLHRVCKDCNRMKSDKTDLEFRLDNGPARLRYIYSLSSRDRCQEVADAGHAARP